MKRSGIAWLVANGVSMFVARLLPPFFSFAINVAIARAFGAESFGVYSQLMALLLVCQALAGMGMPLLVARELASHPEDARRYLTTAKGMASIGGVVGAVGMLAGEWVLLEGRANREALVLCATILPSTWIALQESVFIAWRSHHCITAVALIENVVKVGVAGLALALGGGLFWVCAAIAFSRFVALWTGQRMMASATGLGAVGVSFRAIGPFAREVAPFSALFIMAMVYFRVDVLVLAGLRSDAEVGIYAAALSLYYAALLLPDSMMAAVFPRLSRLYSGSPREFADTAVLSAVVIGAGMVLASAGLIIAAGPLLQVLYGGRFGDAAQMLRLVAASLPFHAANVALGQALQASHLQGAAVRISATGFSAQVALCMALVPQYGAMGAAGSTVLSAVISSAASVMVFNSRVAPLAFVSSVLVNAVLLSSPLVLVLLPSGSGAQAAGTLAVATLASAHIVQTVAAAARSRASAGTSPPGDPAESA